MRDPYEVLTLKKGATKDDVKRAYKRLAKQYHPDQYGDNPLKDLAEDKMRELNEAYDYLMKSIPDNSSYSSSQSQSKSYNQSSSYNQSNNYNQSNQYNDYSSNNVNVYSEIRGDINRGNLRAAEQKLSSVKTRDAEWNYLMGVLFSKKGWHDSARNYITTAYNMSPANVEYRNAYNQLNTINHNFRQNYYHQRSSRDNDMCDLCFKLWCADSLCECMGGDLIDCM